MPHEAVKKTMISSLFASGLTIILRKAYSRQPKSRISLISQYCGSDRSFCGPTFSFVFSPDIVNQEFIVLADEVIIETKRQYCEVKIKRLLNALG